MSKRLVRPPKNASTINREVNRTVESGIPTLTNNHSIPRLKVHNHSVLEGAKINSKVSNKADNQLYKLRDKIDNQRNGNMSVNTGTSNDNPLHRVASKRKKVGMLRNFTHSVAH